MFGRTGILHRVTASPAGDTRLGMWGCWGQEDPGRALGRLEQWAELCYPAPLHRWGRAWHALGT